MVSWHTFWIFRYFLKHFVITGTICFYSINSKKLRKKEIKTGCICAQGCTISKISKNLKRFVFIKICSEIRKTIYHGIQRNYLNKIITAILIPCFNNKNKVKLTLRNRNITFQRANKLQNHDNSECLKFIWK